MRSRYSAYTQAKISYIKKTMRGPALDNFNPQKSKTWAKQATWISLEVVSTKDGQPEDNQGWVEYIATYQNPRGIRQLHELSEFHKIDGKWYYIDGEHYS